LPADARNLTIPAESELKYLTLFTWQAGRGRMKNPGFQFRQIWFVGVSCIALAGPLHAESPPIPPGPRPAKTQRTMPQVIYHVRPASNYAATLHSQEKTRINDLPIDSGMPSSLQQSRENANAAAAENRVRQESPQKQPQLKRPRIEKKQMMRPPMSMKSHGHGKGHKH
jgi:hypothetical protein